MHITVLMQQQQQYACINTLKNLDEMETIVRGLGMEIIVKARTVILDFDQLSIEERIAWTDSVAVHMRGVVDNYTTDEKLFQEIRVRRQEYMEEIQQLIKSYKNNPEIDIVKTIKSLNEKYSLDHSQ